MEQALFGKARRQSYHTATCDEETSSSRNETRNAMPTSPIPDWNPRSERALRDQRAACDAMRESMPVAYSELLQWSVFRHQDVVDVLLDHQTYSNATSRYLSIPHGMDPPEHTSFRAVVEQFFAPHRMAAFEPRCRSLAAGLVDEMLRASEAEVMSSLALPYAAEAQCRFLGWPTTLAEPLISWTHRNGSATLQQDRSALAQLASEFGVLVGEQLDARQTTGDDLDVTTELMRQSVAGRLLSREEISSILRNWTAGEIGSLSAAVGILIQYLAEHKLFQDQLRAEPLLLPEAIDEILRLNAPLIANRRLVAKETVIQGRTIPAGSHVSLMWISANRDGRVFDAPDEFRFGRDPGKNLLYGAGIHVCPGAPLARLELRLIVEELLARTEEIRPLAGRLPTNAAYPNSGYAKAFVDWRKK
jgi:cytochrome P450